MEFHENRSRQPFIGYIQLAKSIKNWWQRHKKNHPPQPEITTPPHTVCLKNETLK